MKIHGLRKTRLYGVWNTMKQRCYNKNCGKYPEYGGRGITVCGEWLNDFKKFYDWAMASGYREGLTIDRIDNDGDYSPENCRFATMKEQNNNRRDNVLITVGGATKTIAQWAAEAAVCYKTLYNRYRRGDAGEHLLRPVA
jgi:hypothetical protein